MQTQYRNLNWDSNEEPLCYKAGIGGIQRTLKTKATQISQRYEAI